MTKIKDIIHELERWAPLPYQESYDNAGLIVGDQDCEVENALICLDVTPEVIEEATHLKAGLVIAHHPLIFGGISSVTPHDIVGRCIVQAIRHNIAVYAIHTNLDHVSDGVNSMLAEKLGIQNPSILSAKHDLLAKLTTFVPADHTHSVLTSLYSAGAGNIGKYQGCSFRTTGTGTFVPEDGANPYIGTPEQAEEVAEERIEVIFPKYRTPAILKALHEAHPYEEVAHYLYDLANAHQTVGAGMIGSLPAALATSDFLAGAKEALGVPVLRHTAIIKEKVQKIALCGGAGSFLINTAKKQQADVFITADLKYHDFFRAEGRILLVDAGHYETEQYTKDLIFQKLREKFSNIALHLTKVNTNPITYL